VKKVLVFNHTGQVSGAEIVTLNLFKDNPRFDPVLAAPEGPFTEAFKRQGHRALPCPELFHHPRSRGNPFWYLAFPFRVRRAARRLRDAIDEIRPDFIMAVSGISLLYARNLGTAPPLVWMCHEIYGPHLGITRFIPSLAPRAAKIVAVSQAVMRRLVELSVPQDRILVVPNAVDAIGRLNPASVTPASLPGPDGRFRAGFIGGIQPLKGLEVLIEAFTRLPDRDRSSLYVVGAPWPETEKYAAAIRSRAPTQVFFLGWRADVPEILAALDLVVVPSALPEAFGLAALEGMAMERTVLASRIGGLVEFVRHGETGYLFEPGDAAGLARLWADAMNGKLGPTGPAARRFVLSEYALEPWRKRLSDLLSS
jgi:glycosyltransferase involved in cell wall biosynthesis